MSVNKCPHKLGTQAGWCLEACSSIDRTSRLKGRNCHSAIYHDYSEAARVQKCAFPRMVAIHVADDMTATPSALSSAALLSLYHNRKARIYASRVLGKSGKATPSLWANPTATRPSLPKALSGSVGLIAETASSRLY